MSGEIIDKKSDLAVSSAREVRVIPATKKGTCSTQLKEQIGVRVAAYCRVSTGDESQQTSYTSQKAFYTRLINERAGWYMAGIYADEGLSGTCRAKRVEFNRMMDDAMNGKIGYIVTKSISRFARNTLDTLDCVRQLKAQDPPVGIYFEKENIDTLDVKGELMLTILSALAQDESRSISDNIRWAFQKRFQEGRPQINLQRMLGYDMGAHGQWIINEPQAQTVRIIFSMYVGGRSANAIAGELNDKGVFTINGKFWSASSVLIVLRNEKYVGDLAMQKTVTKSFLTHQSVANTGEAPMYYVKNHHSPIIDRDTWNQAQLLVNRHKEKRGRQKKTEVEPQKKLPHEMNMFCACCESKFVALTYIGQAKNYQDERALSADERKSGQFSEKYTYRYNIYRCGTRIENKEDAPCTAENLCEIALQQSFMECIYAIREDYLKNAENSWICTQFAQNCGNAVRRAHLHPYKPDLQESFDLFISCLIRLPEPETDFLNFDKGLYNAFILKGVAKDDTVIYTTNFGVSLVTTGNKRSLTDFIGKTRQLPDGTPELLTEEWQVNGKKISYSRKERKRGKNTGQIIWPK